MAADRLDVLTPLGFRVRCTRDYWDFIASHKHPGIRGSEEGIIEVLRDPDEVRQSRKDPGVLLFYRGKRPRWLCAVTRRQDDVGFLITAYQTDSIKVGVTLWKRSS